MLSINGRICGQIKIIIAVTLVLAMFYLENEDTKGIFLLSAGIIFIVIGLVSFSRNKKEKTIKNQEGIFDLVTGIFFITYSIFQHVFIFIDSSYLTFPRTPVHVYGLNASLLPQHPNKSHQDKGLTPVTQGLSHIEILLF